MNRPDPAAPAELADGKDADRGEAAPPLPSRRAQPDDPSNTHDAKREAGADSGENACGENAFVERALASPAASQNDLRAGLFFAPYRW